MTSLLRKILIRIFFIAIILVIVMPFVWMIISSVKNQEELFSKDNLFPSQISFSNYSRLFADTHFLRYLINSCFVGFMVAIISTVLATFTSYAYSRFQFRGKKILGGLTLMVYMMAPVMIVIPLYILFRALSLGNTLTSVIIAHITFVYPFAFWVMNGYIKDFPEELEKTAIIDGANFFRTFYYVIVPNLIQGITSVAVFSFILSWNDYVFARILITGDEKKTLPVGIDDMFSATVTDWGVIMAAGVIISLPVIAGYVFVSRYIDKAVHLKYT